MSQPAGAVWPADVIHVNEDGWVLINRGSSHGVYAGLHLLVVSDSTRDLHDLFAPGDADASEPLPVLRIRRTYELLEVIFTEESCSIAIATRTPAARRPTVYRGPEGELLVWVPLPEGYTWPPANDSNMPQQPATPPWASASDGEGAMDDDQSEGDDSPPERAPQDDEPWEEALPLNSVSVGDIVLPAVPAVPSPAAPASLSTPAMQADGRGSIAASGHESTTPFDAGRTYDWMKKSGE